MSDDTSTSTSKSTTTTQSSANGPAPSATSTTTGNGGLLSRVFSSIAKAADPTCGRPGDPDSTAISEYLSTDHATQKKRE